MVVFLISLKWCQWFTWKVGCLTGEFPAKRPVTLSFDVNNREAGDLRRHSAHYDPIVMIWVFTWRRALVAKSHPLLWTKLRHFPPRSTQLCYKKNNSRRESITLCWYDVNKLKHNNIVCLYGEEYDWMWQTISSDNAICIEKMPCTYMSVD